MKTVIITILFVIIFCISITVVLAIISVWCINEQSIHIGKLIVQGDSIVVSLNKQNKHLEFWVDNSFPKMPHSMRLKFEKGYADSSR